MRTDNLRTEIKCVRRHKVDECVCTLRVYLWHSDLGTDSSLKKKQNSVSATLSDFLRRALPASTRPAAAEECFPESAGEFGRILNSYISFAASVSKEHEETRHSHTFPKIKDEFLPVSRNEDFDKGKEEEHLCLTLVNFNGFLFIWL